MLQAVKEMKQASVANNERLTNQFEEMATTVKTMAVTVTQLSTCVTALTETVNSRITQTRDEDVDMNGGAGGTGGTGDDNEDTGEFAEEREEFVPKEARTTVDNARQAGICSTSLRVNIANPLFKISEGD